VEGEEGERVGEEVGRPHRLRCGRRLVGEEAEQPQELLEAAGLDGQ
jgi:hypothetical protein